MLTKLDRYRGAMLGTLCGDAVGAPYEWQKSVDIKADLAKRGLSIPADFELFDYIEPWKKKQMVRKGHPTDDSELAAALAMSLVEMQGLNDKNLFGHLRSFIIDRKSVLTSEAYGTGSTLRAALTPPTYAESCARFALGEIPTPPSNGSLMRCIAVPLMFDTDMGLLIAAARAQSFVTHRNPLSVAACVAYSVYTSFILEGVEPRRAWLMTCAMHLNDAYAQVVGLEVTMPTDEDIWPEKPRGPGDAVTSLRVAVWASIEATDFADGIIKAVSVGGDTDTYAAIAGGILGARFGIQGIPEEWKAALQGREIMEDLAGKLYKLAHR